MITMIKDESMATACRQSHSRRRRSVTALKDYAQYRRKLGQLENYPYLQGQVNIVTAGTEPQLH